LTTVKNTQANGILECTHQVIGNLLHSSHLIAQDLDTVSAQQELLMPVAYVGHQHNIPYDLKSKPSSTCIQPQHDSSNFLHCQLVGAAGKFEWFE
jgi:hypothetical protein